MATKLKGLRRGQDGHCEWRNAYPRGDIRCVYVGDGEEPYYCEWDGTGDPAAVLSAACDDFADTYDRGKATGDIICTAWIGTEDEQIVCDSFAVPDPDEETV